MIINSYYDISYFQHTQAKLVCFWWSGPWHVALALLCLVAQVWRAPSWLFQRREHRLVVFTWRRVKRRKRRKRRQKRRWGGGALGLSGWFGLKRFLWEGRRTSCGATRREVSKRQNLWSLTGKGLSGLRFCIGCCWSLGNESKGSGDAVELHTWWLELVGLGASLQAPDGKV